MRGCPVRRVPRLLCNCIIVLDHSQVHGRKLFSSTTWGLPGPHHEVRQVHTTGFVRSTPRGLSGPHDGVCQVHDAMFVRSSIRGTTSVGGQPSAAGWSSTMGAQTTVHLLSCASSFWSTVVMYICCSKLLDAGVLHIMFHTGVTSIWTVSLLPITTSCLHTGLNFAVVHTYYFRSSETKTGRNCGDRK